MKTVTSVYDFFPNIDKLRNPAKFPDVKDEFFWEVFGRCGDASMIELEAFYNIFRSVEYIVKNRLPGDFVECGVFLGGAIIAAAEFLAHFEGTERKIYLYDTFEGFPENTKDFNARGDQVNLPRHRNFRECVEENLKECNYPTENFIVVEGPVERTLSQGPVPDEIAFLRLDTDYYESTRVEFEQLFPKLVHRGVCTIDDYGTFQGARRATDEYLEKLDEFPMVVRLTAGVRMLVKS